MRVITGRIGGIAAMGMGILVAMGLSAIVRPVTAELTQTLGTVWPFSTVHCTSPAPGCDPAAQPMEGGFGSFRR